MMHEFSLSGDGHVSQTSFPHGRRHTGAVPHRLSAKYPAAVYLTVRLNERSAVSIALRAVQQLGV
jgi:hypothetical protein